MSERSNSENNPPEELEEEKSKGKMKTICYVCKRVFKITEGIEGASSHGVCENCMQIEKDRLDKEFAELEKKSKKKK